MISCSAMIVRTILRLYTYPYRKNHRSLSRSVELKNRRYAPPKRFCFEVKEIDGTKVEILSPIEADPSYAVVQFHGGGHTQPMNGIYRKAAERYAEMLSCTVYSIDYKTGGGLVYPSVHDECFAVYTELLKEILKERRVIAVGDSFGANLMLSTCLRLRDGNLPLPCALISASCYVDLASTGDSYRKNCYSDPLYALPKTQKFEDCERLVRRITPYCGRTDPFDPLLSPAYADYRGFPPILIQCGDCETSESDSDLLYDAFLKGGAAAKLTKYRGMWHDFQYLTPWLRESKTAWREAEQFVNGILGGKE